jgi:hypothetical protein
MVYEEGSRSVYREKKNVLTGHQIPVIGFLARHFIEFPQLPVKKKLSLDM